jgi:DNA polymerase-3 subunit epsilon
MKFASRLRTQTDDALPISTWSGKVSGHTVLSECPFVVVDTELSGLDAKKDFIVSIGALKMTGGTIHISKEFYRLIRPKGEVTKKSVEIHGITPGELDGEADLEQIMNKFLDFIGDSVIIGHFIHLDLSFLNRELKRRFSRKLPNPAADTQKIYEWLYENSLNFKKHYPGGPVKTDLFSLANRYGVSVNTLHNALSDSFITAQLFQKFLYFLKTEGIITLNDLIDIGRA